MSKKTIFILKNRRTYRRSVRIFLKNVHGKFEERLIIFTTEHLVNDKDRKKKARTVGAEFSTSDSLEIDALLSDTSYGITFVQKGDDEGKLKKPTRNISPNDLQKLAYGNLFAQANLKFDSSKPLDLLKQEYESHMALVTGRQIGVSTASSIPHEPVDVKQNIKSMVAVALEGYEKKYGEAAPEIVANDLAFIDGLSNPEFDPKAYITEKLKNSEDSENTEESIESLQKKYFKKFNKNVAPVKKNDKVWIKAKLAEN